PAISGAAVSPPSIPADGKGYNAVVSARMSAATPLINIGAQAFLLGFADQPGALMTDSGGGAFFGSIFFSTTEAGPRVIRMKAETVGTDGMRHATAVDVGGFTVR